MNNPDDNLKMDEKNIGNEEMFKETDIDMDPLTAAGQADAQAVDQPASQTPDQTAGQPEILGVDNPADTSPGQETQDSPQPQDIQVPTGQEKEPKKEQKRLKWNLPKQPSILFLPLGGCNGCHITFLDLHEQLLDVLPAVEIKRASVIADVNRKEIPEVDIAIIEGAVCNDDQLSLLNETRSKCKILIALGSCSAYGGVPGLRNYYDVNECIEEAYVGAVSNVNPDKVTPDDYEVVPKMLSYVYAVPNVVEVDYIIPGCPPVPEMIKDALVSLVSGLEPKIPTKNLCEECHRTHNKIIAGDRQFITFNIDTVIESELDRDLCFLEQGVLCMGPATRSGCGGRCTHANMPCRGCFGPNVNAIEQGCEMSNAMAPVLPIGALISKEDLPGTFYRYALPSSIIPKVIKNHNEVVRCQMDRELLSAEMESSGKVRSEKYKAAYNHDMQEGSPSPQ